MAQSYAAGDMVVLVATERQRGKVADLPEQDWSLRVTLVFRRDGSEWRLAHRHADPLVHEIHFEQVAALARAQIPVASEARSCVTLRHDDGILVFRIVRVYLWRQLFSGKRVAVCPSVSVVDQRHWRQNTMSTLELVAPVPSSRAIQGLPIRKKNSDTDPQCCSLVSVVVHVGWGQRRVKLTY